jgi:hypothetical protein
MIEAIYCPESSVLSRVKQRHVPEEGILHNNINLLQYRYIVLTDLKIIKEVYRFGELCLAMLQICLKNVEDDCKI